MIITNLNWEQLNSTVDSLINDGVVFNEPLCIDREMGVYEIEIEGHALTIQGDAYLKSKSLQN
jgi:hypothetical protein